jgi:hypothetical protein
MLNPSGAESLVRSVGHSRHEQSFPSRSQHRTRLCVLLVCDHGFPGLCRHGGVAGGWSFAWDGVLRSACPCYGLRSALESQTCAEVAPEELGSGGGDSSSSVGDIGAGRDAGREVSPAAEKRGKMTRVPNHHTQRTPRLRRVCLLHQRRAAAGVDR